jgi:hypothetical protein
MMISRRCIDFLNGFLYGIGGGLLAFGAGFLWGKIAILGYKLTWMAA